MGSLLLYPGSWCTQSSVCVLQESIFQSCVSSGSSMVGLMVTSSTRTYATPRSAAPRTSSGDAQTQFWLSLGGVSGSFCGQGLFEPSERLCRKWGLILNANLSILPSCWGNSALGRGVSPHRCSRTAQLPLQ